MIDISSIWKAGNRIGGNFYAFKRFSDYFGGIVWDCKISKLLRNEDALVNDAVARWLSELDDWNSVDRYMQY